MPHKTRTRVVSPKDQLSYQNRNTTEPQPSQHPTAFARTLSHCLPALFYSSATWVASLFHARDKPLPKTYMTCCRCQGSWSRRWCKARCAIVNLYL